MRIERPFIVPKGERSRARRMLAALGPINIGARAEEDLGGIHDGLRERWVRMDSQRDVLGEGAHFDREPSLRDQFASASADNSNTQHAFGLRIDDQLGRAFRAVEGQGTSGSAPGELGNFYFAIVFLCLSLG